MQMFTTVAKPMGTQGTWQTEDHDRIYDLWLLQLVRHRTGFSLTLDRVNLVNRRKQLRRQRNRFEYIFLSSMLEAVVTIEIELAWVSFSLPFQ